MHRKNKRGYKVKKNKVEGSNVIWLYGGYYYDQEAKRIKRYYARRLHKWLKSNFSRRQRRADKQNIAKENYEAVGEKPSKNDMWNWD